jgi:glutamate-1-semialdehyde 2,1-aminomutase
VRHGVRVDGEEVRVAGLIRQALRFRATSLSSAGLVTLGPVVTRGKVVELRPPVAADAIEWSRLVRPERDRLEPRWADSDLDWVMRTSADAWRDRCAELRRLAKDGTALPFLITVDGDIAGELLLDRVDRERGCAEVEAWISEAREGASITASALRLLLLHAFGEYEIRRLTAAIPVGDRSAAVLFSRAGFRREGMLRGYRRTADYELWSLLATDRPDESISDLPIVSAMEVPGSGRGFERSSALQRRLHELVPGGAHTYARGSDQYPEGMAPVLVRGDGSRVWDADGNCFIEYGMGLRSVTLGHGYRPVLDAVQQALATGVNFSRPTQIEVAAAEDFLSLVPGADMVKFAKNGSDATTAAIRLARAVTGRDMVAVCDQPFFSADDWFIGAVEMNAGVPDATRGHTVRFQFNDLDSLRLRFAESGGQIACVVMEAATALAEPEPGFLEGVRALCDSHGSLLVFDEMITGFRWSASGAQSVYGVRPDLSCWGKAMGNGFPISALAGRRDLMELGGLRTESPRVFLLSTTHGPETVSLAAFRAVVRAYTEGDPIGVMERRGTELAEGVNAAARELGVAEYVAAIGRPSCLVFTTRDEDGRPSQPYRTLFLQEMLRRGVLGQSFVISAAHTVADVELTVQAVREALVVYRRALEDGGVDRFLNGRPVAPALRSLASPRQL